MLTRAEDTDEVHLPIRDSVLGRVPLDGFGQARIGCGCVDGVDRFVEKSLTAGGGVTVLERSQDVPALLVQETGASAQGGGLGTITVLFTECRPREVKPDL